MHLNLIKTLTVFLFFMPSISEGHNAKLLEIEANRYKSRIFSVSRLLETPEKEAEEIQETSLSFLRDRDPLDPKYLSLRAFENFYDLVIQSIHKTPAFLDFAQICHNIYYGTADEKKKVGIFMLFEKVSEKVKDHLKWIIFYKKKREQAELAYQAPSQEEREKVEKLLKELLAWD